MVHATTERFEFAPAKVNLTLRIGRKRPDGYHDLESLVIFADVGDTVRLLPGEAMALTVTGATAAQAGATDSNLVLKATRALAAQVATLRTGHFHLTKQLPVAAGLGGGSSDAAAALRLVAQLNDLPLQDARVMAAARATGADVPVCLDPQPRIMRGIGDILTAPLRLPRLPAVMVNPGVPVPTGQVFSALAAARATAGAIDLDGDPASKLVEMGREVSPASLIEALAASSNDLEAPALALFPAVGETLAALRATGSCRLARMSGSGGTCFGLFSTPDDAQQAAERLAKEHPHWWVRATTFGSAAAAPAAMPSSV